MELIYYSKDTETCMCVKGMDAYHIYERAEVGIDGNCGYALLGANIQEGECEFVEIRYSSRESPDVSERRAWGEALSNLRKRLGAFIPYFVKG